MVIRVTALGNLDGPRMIGLGRVHDADHAALAALRRRETVRVVVASCAAMSRIEAPRSVSRRTTSSCSAGVRRSSRMPWPATAAGGSSRGPAGPGRGGGCPGYRGGFGQPGWLRSPRCSGSAWRCRVGPCAPVACLAGRVRPDPGCGWWRCRRVVVRSHPRIARTASTAAASGSVAPAQPPRRRALSRETMTLLQDGTRCRCRHKTGRCCPCCLRKCKQPKQVMWAVLLGMVNSG